METLIAMRCVQAIGSAAVVSVGAGSLADIFEVHERGQKVGCCSFRKNPKLNTKLRMEKGRCSWQLGLFYGMPLLGPSLGPLIGGALGNVSRNGSMEDGRGD